MESASQVFGDHDTEECHSSESGWTMYIGSPINDGVDDHHHQEDDDDEDGNYEDDDHQHHDGDAGGEDDDDREEVDSDDSMASDASSGPSAYPFLTQGHVVGTDLGKFREDDDSNGRFRFEKMKSERMEKQSGGGRRRKKDQVVFMATTNTCAPAQSSKSIWTSKSK